MNVFLKIGEWIERKPLAGRVSAVEAKCESIRTAAADHIAGLENAARAQSKELVELKEYVAKMAMYTGMRQLGKSPEDIREAITAWGQIGNKK